MKNSFKKMALSIGLSTMALGLVATTCVAEQLKVDANLSDYVKVQGVAGNLNSVGSDTLNNLMTFWAESYRKKYPNVRIQIEGKGSSTAPPALISGTAQIGPMSRTMKGEELDAFEKQFGYKPTPIRVAVDGPAEAPAVLMWNGARCTLAMWDLVVERMASRFRTVRFDIVPIDSVP